MKIVTVSKGVFNPIPLPGMGRSIDLPALAEQELLEIRAAYAQGELFVEFVEEPGTPLQVKQLWANPHAMQLTLFV